MCYNQHMESYIHILLDLDDTVFDFPQSEKIAFGKTMEKLGIDNVDSICNPEFRHHFLL